MKADDNQEERLMDNETEKNVKFEEWKVAAQACADELEVVDKDKLWEESDPYDLKEVAAAAFAKGQDPKDFIKEIFSDDLAADELHDQQVAETLGASDDGE